MRLLRTIAVTFGLYSRIPMPRFEWQDEDMRCSMAVFPWVGAVIGALFAGAGFLCLRSGMPAAAAAMLLTCIPLILTGGFHVDGFMDVCDAVSSFRSREEKLRILKDPHIGAFAVIRLAVAGLIWLASMIIILSGEDPGRTIAVMGAAFFLARAFSALAVLTFRSAKREGMLYYEAETASGGRNFNLVFTYLWLILGAAVMIYAGRLTGAAVVVASLLSFAWYRYMSYREFGGITGDTAGYFVTICEVASAAAVAAMTASGIN